MLRRALSVCAVLGLVSAANAGVVISLVPEAAPPGGYQLNQTIRVDVTAVLTPGTPGVQPTVGTQNQIRVRAFNLDLTDTSSGLGITGVLNHPDSDLDFDGTPTPIPFWFFSNPGCTNDSTSCGAGYFIDSDLVTITPNILNITYTGLASNPNQMISLNQTAPKVVASMEVTFNALGLHTLDVLNADETNENLGAEIEHGFGVPADPTDPASPLRANGGELTMLVGQEGGLSFNVVPEPATLALLGLGGVAAAFRRRRSA